MIKLYLCIRVAIVYSLSQKNEKLHIEFLFAFAQLKVVINVCL